MIHDWGNIYAPPDNLSQFICDIEFSEDSKYMFTINQEGIMKKFILAEKYYTEFTTKIFDKEAQNATSPELSNKIQLQYRKLNNKEYLFVSTVIGKDYFNNKLGKGHVQFCLETEKVVLEWESVFKKVSDTIWNKYCDDHFQKQLEQGGEALKAIWSSQMAIEMLKRHTTTQTNNLLTDNYIFASYYDGTIKQYDLVTKNCLMTYRNLHNYSIENMVCTQDEQNLFTADGSGVLKQISFSDTVDNRIKIYDGVFGQGLKLGDFDNEFRMFLTPDSQNLFIVKQAEKIEQICVKNKTHIRSFNA